MASSGRAAAPHAPVLGLSQRLLGRFHVTGVFWYQFPHWCIAHLPLWTHRGGIVVFSAGFFVVLGRIRRAIAANLDPVLGPATGVARLRRSFVTMREFARCLSERYSRLAGTPRGPSRVEGLEHWQRVRDAKCGAVLVTAHIGPWESATLEGVSDASRRIHVVREAEIDPRAQAFVRNILGRAGNNYVAHFAGEDPRLVLELVEALRRGEIVALQGDRPRANGRNVTVTMFGQPMPLPVGPAILARAAEVPLVPIFSFLDDDYGMRAVVRPPILVARTADREADVAAAVTRIGEEIAWAIHQKPHQWFCFRRLWDRPEAASAPRHRPDRSAVSV